MRSRNHFRRTQRMRYEARRFHNPYFQKKPERNWRLIGSVFGVAMAVVVVVGVLFGSPYLAIGSVSVSGTQTVSPDAITQTVWDQLNARRGIFFHASNRFLYDESKLRDALSASYAFQTLDLTRTCASFGVGNCSLNVRVEEKTSQLLWKTGDHVYLADLQGMVIRELSPDEVARKNAPAPVPPAPLPDGTVPPAPPPDPLTLLPQFTDVNSAPATAGASVLTADEVKNIFAFHDDLKQAGIPFTETRIDRLAGKWMAVRTGAGYDIYFDAVGDIAAQFAHLQVLLRDTIKDPSALQYIDLRFGDHVYYK